MEHDILYSEEEIQARVQDIAQRISDKHAGQEIVLVGVLKGAFMFLRDLGVAIEKIGKVASCKIDFVSTSSYGHGRKPGDVKIELDLRRSVLGKIVIVVEDVGDRLHTLYTIIQHVGDKNPAVLEIATFFMKPDKHERDDVKVDYVGISQRDAGFLYGYGMDLAGACRCLPFIAVADPE